jgi:tetratricopeptide (TPR) repeat protein
MNIFGLLVFALAALCSIPAIAVDLPEDQITLPPLKKALEELGAHNRAGALRILTGFKPDSASMAQYHFVYGRLDIGQQKPLQAVEHFSKAYLYAPKGDLKEIALLERAETYIKMKYFYEARTSYGIFLKTFPESRFLGKVYFGLAKSLAETGSLRDALTYYEKAGATPEVLLGKANVLHRLGKTQEAAAIYATARLSGRQLLSASDESLFYLGENMLFVNKPEDAKRYLSDVKGQPFRTRAELLLGQIALHSNKTDEAMKLFNAALASKDREVRKQALLNMSDLEIKEGKTTEAKARLEEIRAKYPYGRAYEEALLKLAGIFRQEGAYEKATGILAGLAARPAVREEALAGLEQTFRELRSKDRKQFAGLWKTGGALLMDVSREKFLLEVADDLRNEGKAFSDLMQYLAKYGTESAKIRSLAALAGNSIAKGDVAGSEGYMLKLRQLKGSAEEIIALEARIAFVQKDHKTAAQKLLQLKKLHTDDVKMLGNILDLSHDQPKAVARYEKAVRESGGDAEAYVRLGDFMYEAGKNKEALNYFRLAFGKDPGNDWALYRIGLLAEGPEAEAALKKVSRADPMLTKLSGARLRELDLTKKGVENFR